MGSMKSPAARDWTGADAYEFLPESRTRRHEVIDGELFVSPEASELHQRRAFELAMLLEAACPPGLRVSGGSINLDIGDRRHLEPDLAVKRIEDFGVAESVPLLVVEVLSPSNWRHDAHRKRQVYAELGVPSYWLVEPHAPSVTLLDLVDLVDGEYVESETVGPGEELVASRPFEVRLAPGEWTQLP